MTGSDRSTWESLEPWQQALAWKEHPEMALRAIQSAERELRRRHRLEVLDHLVPFSPSVFGVIAVCILAFVSLRFLDSGEATLGAWIFGGTAVALATVFVTGKSVVGRLARPPAMPAEDPQQAA